MSRFSKSLESFEFFEIAEQTYAHIQLGKACSAVDLGVECQSREIDRIRFGKPETQRLLRVRRDVVALLAVSAEEKEAPRPKKSTPKSV
jgi:hypothetical protein